MQFPSKLIEDAVNAFATLPGIGKKTALRLVMYLLQKEAEDTQYISAAILKMRNEIKFCTSCHNVSDDDRCSICTNAYRDKTVLCVVENFRDIIAIENTRHYNGLYHVLDGLISPMDGIGPDALNIQTLEKRIQENEIKEVIMALNPTIDGDTTIFYLSKILDNYAVKITSIARGIAFGGELEYVDEITLARSIQSRLPYENYLGKL
ncbi:MAG TPA: recombination mediator RecR [Chitinophagales bacterium]|jgi:recombination protein RecR|nr:recombination protein RecR [Chitinophagales bacterium]MBP6153722.1 recombination protein RecR [Chitinophagales bacterium]HQV77856.1 recombination mediator RecR [Chitinophagales bacterium]HQW78577.1 recombination mediator RecR [Chitinophagales bacterium]HRB66936.1 recombination mediator RecR [Chitinophagales bacterium]